MTKKRIMAGILCLMMVMTLLPMAAFAIEGTFATYASIEDIVGEELLIRKTCSFTDANAENLYVGASNGVESLGVSFDTENGLKLEPTEEVSAPRWRIGSNNSSSLGSSKAIYFRSKVEEGEVLNLYFHIPDVTANQAAYEMIITPESVLKGRYSHGTQVAPFVPANAFVEYLVLDREDGEGMFVYAKSADQYDGNWVCVLNMTTFNPSLSSTSEVYYTGSGAVQELILYDTIKEYQSIGDIVGREILEEKNYDFTVADAEALYGTKGLGFDFNNVSFNENGMILSGDAPRWRFGSNNSTTLGNSKAVFYRAKVDAGNTLNVYLHVPDTTADLDVYEVAITPEAVTSGKYSVGRPMVPFVPGTDFVDYFAIDREDGRGLFIYARRASQYNGNWVCVLNEKVPNGDLSSNAEVYFTGIGSVQKVTKYSCFDSYASLNDIAGKDLLKDRDYDFTVSNAETLYGTSGCGFDFGELTFDSENGMTLAGSAPRWRFGSNNSSSLGKNKAIYFKMKADPAKDTLLYLHVPDTTADQDAYALSIGATGVTSVYQPAKNGVPFAPGEAVAEYLAIDEGSGLKLYGRTDALYDGRWVELLETTGINPSLSSSCEVYFTQAGSVQNLVVYRKPVTYRSIQEVMGKDVVEIGNYDFTVDNAESLYGTAGCGFDFHEVTFDAENGMSLSGSAPRWRFGSNNSSSLGKEKAVYFRAKVDEGNTLTLYLHVADTTADQDAYEVAITPEAVNPGRYSQGKQLEPFAPGTDFAEYLAIDREDGNGLLVYARSENQYSGNWVCIMNETVCNGSLSASAEVYFSGVGCVQKIAQYNQFESFAKIEDILGKDVYANRDCDFTVSDAESLYGSTGCGFDFNEVTFDSENGMTLTGAAPRWRFGGNNSSALGKDKAVYFKMKANPEKNTTLYLHVPDTTADKTVYAISIGATGVTSVHQPTQTFVPFAPGEAFAEYLAIDEGSGLKFYAKTPELYGGKWVKVMEATGVNGNLSDSSEVYFTQAGSIQALKLYSALDTYEDAAQIAGATLYPYKSFNFNEEYASVKYVTKPAYDYLDVSFDATNGMVLSDTNLEDTYAPRWRYYKEDSWSAIDEGRVIYFKAKVDASQKMEVFFKQPGDETEKKEQAYKLNIAADGLSTGVVLDNLIPFVPGNDWVEYIIAKTETGMAVYAKKDGFVDGLWVQVIHTTTTYTVSKSSALYFTGNGLVNNAVIYTPNAEDEEEEELIIIPENEIYDSIQTIVGGEVISKKSFDMSNKDYQSQGGFVFKPAGEHTPENGAPIDSTLEGGTGFWRYNNATENWSPLTVGSRYVYFKLKVEEGKQIEVKVQNPEGNNQYGSFTISPTAFGKNNFSVLTYAREGGAGTDFVEYLIVAEKVDRIRLYAKGLTDDGKWVLAAVGTGYSASDNANIGLYFAGEGYLKQVDLYEKLDTSLIFEDVPQIAGATLYPFKSFKFAEAYASKVYLSKPSYDYLDVAFDATNGMVLSDLDVEDGYSPRWRYYKEDSWSAIDEGRVIYFKAKVDASEKMEIYFKQPDDETEKKEQAYKLIITANGLSSGESSDNLIPFTTGTEWIEYVVAKTATGMAVYVKKDGFVGGKWVQVIHTTTTYGISKNSALYFTGTGSVNNAVIYTPNAEDEEEFEIPIIPENEIYDSIQDIVGSEVIAYKSFDMSNKDYQNQGGFVFKPVGEHTPENGAPIDSTLEGGTGFWRYYNATENWSPLDGNTKVAYFKLKVEEGNQVEVKVQNPAGENKYGSFTISPDAFGKNNFSTLAYAREGGAGTDFVEYLIVAEKVDRIRLYAKGLTDDGKWVLAAVGAGYGASDNSSIGLYFAGNGYLKQVDLYEAFDESLLYKNIESIVGNSIYPYKDFMFTMTNFDAIRPAGKYDQTEITFTAENGLVLENVIDEENDPENQIFPRWRFADEDGWSAIDNGRVVYFKAKADATTPTIAYFKMPNDTSEKGEAAYTLNIAANGITSDATAESFVPFAPGTEWAEYLVAKTETGMAVYARQDGFLSGKWVQILHVTATANVSKHSAVYFTRAGAIQHLTIYEVGMEFTTVDSVKALAGNVVAAQNFDFKPGFDITVGGGTYIVTEPIIDETGMLLSESADWRFYSKGGSKWSPLDNGNIAVFSAKVSDYDDILYSWMKPPADVDPEQKAKVSIEIKASGVLINGGQDVEMKFNFVPGLNWVEYMVQPNDNNGYNVWVKAELFGNDKWHLLAETTAYAWENGSGNTGYRFRCNETAQAYLGYAKVYTTQGVMEEAPALPENAGFKYFEENFDSPLMVHNVKANGMMAKNGALVMAEDRTDGTFTAANVGIPKGGYVEFRTAGPAINAMKFSDGNGSLQLNFNGMGYSVGVAGEDEEFVGLSDGGNIYRTWRIFRNAEGNYTGYTKADGEDIWVKAFEDKAPITDNIAAQIKITSYNADITYDYIKVYGPAPAPVEELTIYDGFGTEELQVADGKANLSYYGAVRVVVKKDESPKTLILAELDNGLMTNIITVPVEAGDGIVVQEYGMKKKGTLKVLVWNDLVSMTAKNIGAQLTAK